MNVTSDRLQLLVTRLLISAMMIMKSKKYFQYIDIRHTFPYHIYLEHCKRLPQPFLKMIGLEKSFHLKSHGRETSE